jgi:hypothetical protein
MVETNANCEGFERQMPQPVQHASSHQGSHFGLFFYNDFVLGATVILHIAQGANFTILRWSLAFASGQYTVCIDTQCEFETSATYGGFQTPHVAIIAKRKHFQGAKSNIVYFTMEYL